MNRAITLIGSIGLGAGLMYLFDPSCGRRRRAFVRGKFVKAAHEMEHTFDAAARDVQHRAQGVMSRVQSSLSNHKVVPKEVLIERVRSQIGRAVSHPHAIHVDAQDGRIALSGPILQSEVGCLLAAVSSVRGVTGIANYLEVHSQSDGIAALQGQGHSAGHQPTRWPPATRLLAGAVGCGLMANCAVRPTPIPIALGTLGFGLFL